LKPERWGSPLVQEKYQEEKACDKRHPYRIIIITNVAILVDRNVTKKEREKIQDSVYRHKTTMEHEMCVDTGNNWSHRKNKGFKEKLGNRTRKIFSSPTKKDDHTWKTTRNTEITVN